MAEENKQTKDKTNGLINCLTNKKVIVRYIVKQSNLIRDPKHVLAGGLAEGSHVKYVAPVYESNGSYYNVLTNAEKDYLEYIMGMEKNALSIYNREHNFWDHFEVTLGKEDTVLDLSVPMDYIKYKVLLANKNFIADSLQTLENKPRETYRFVMIMDDEEDKTNMRKLNTSMEAYMLLGQYMDKRDVLATLLEMLEGRPVSDKVKQETILSRLQDHITNNSKMFVKFANDPLLHIKVLIRKCVAEKLILKRGDYYYLASDNSPLCDAGSEPTINVAAAYLSNPKRSELKYTLEGKLNA